MSTYEVMVEEILCRIVEIEAASEDEALEEAERMYADCEIVLDAGDLVEEAQISLV